MPIYLQDQLETRQELQIYKLMRDVSNTVSGTSPTYNSSGARTFLDLFRENDCFMTFLYQELPEEQFKWLEKALIKAIKAAFTSPVNTAITSTSCMTAPIMDRSAAAVGQNQSSLNSKETVHKRNLIFYFCRGSRRLYHFQNNGTDWVKGYKAGHVRLQLLCRQAPTRLVENGEGKLYNDYNIFNTKYVLFFQYRTTFLAGNAPTHLAIIKRVEALQEEIFNLVRSDPSLNQVQKPTSYSTSSNFFQRRL